MLVIISVPYRFDLNNRPSMNKEIRNYNSKLSKVIKAFKNVQLFKCDN
jgi:hypothetical protein